MLFPVSESDLKEIRVIYKLILIFAEATRSAAKKLTLFYLFSGTKYE